MTSEEPGYEFKPSRSPLAWATIMLSIALLFLLVVLFRQQESIVAPTTINSEGQNHQILAAKAGLVIPIIKENEPVASGQAIAFYDGDFDVSAILALKEELTHQPGAVINLEVCRNLGAVEQYCRAVMEAREELKQLIGLHAAYMTGSQENLRGVTTIQQQVKDSLVNVLEKMRQIKQRRSKNYDIKQSLFNDSIVTQYEINELSTEIEASEVDILAKNNEYFLIDQEKFLLEQRVLDREVELKTRIAIAKANEQKMANSLFSAIQAWEEDFLITSPVAGTVKYASSVGNVVPPSFYANSGDLMLIVGNEEKPGVYYADLKIPGQSIGRCKVGQDVRIHLNGFPVARYGALIGKLTYISNQPFGGAYKARVKMSNGMITMLGNDLSDLKDQSGKGFIITGKRSIGQKIVDEVVYQISEF